MSQTPLWPQAPDLPGCFTQGTTYEEARENLIDAIEVWIIAGLQSGEELPVVNGSRLAGHSISNS